MNEQAVFAVGYSGLVLILWTYHLVRATGRWRDWRDARSLRNFLIAFAVLVGAAALFFGAVGVYASPAFLDVARFLGWVIRGALLLLGLFVVWTWVDEDRRRGR